MCKQAVHMWNGWSMYEMGGPYVGFSGNGCLRLMLFHSFHSGTHFNHGNQARQTVSRWEPPWNPSNLSFLSFQLCFSGCGMLYFFHFFVFSISFRVRDGLFLSFLCVFHFFQGAGWSISFISLCFSYLSGCIMLYFFHFFVFFISFMVQI